MTTTAERRTTDDAEQLLSGPDLLLPAVLNHLEATHERGQQLYPGHSSALGCRRAAAYGVADTPPDPQYDGGGSVQAWIGQAVHRAFLPVLRQLLHPARIELATTWRPLRPDFDSEQLMTLDSFLPPITGHVDLYRRRSRLAIDLKTVSRHQLNRVREDGARPKDLAQLHANAASLTAEGKPCTAVGVLYVCTETSADRADGEGLLWLQPVDPRLTEAVVMWWADVTGFGDPQEAPRDERGPGLSWKCDSCPWLRRCWGPDAKPGQVGPQALAAVESDAVASALQLLAQAQQRAKDARRVLAEADNDSDFAAALLADVPEGTYTGWAGAYELTWTAGQLRMDQAEAARLLGEMNLGVPKKRTAPRPRARAAVAP